MLMPSKLLPRLVIAATFSATTPTALVKPSGPASAAHAEQIAAVNDNRTPAGSRVGDTLVLRLTVSPVTWTILGDSNPGFHVAAFAEEGKTPTIPGPLVRVRVGAPIHVVIRNPLDDTLIVRGLSERGGVRDSLVIPPASVGETRFVARATGTFAYWGALAAAQRAVPLPPAARTGGLFRPIFDSQLAGAFIVDPPGRLPDDRILVITETDDQPPPVRRDRHGITGRQFTAINGRSWPYTERLRYAVGDTIRWRVINTTFQAHPMHLHGFYFRVDSHGSAVTGTDSIYAPEQRRMAVTEVVGIGESISMMWVPDRPGGWVFHCHLTNHAAMVPPVDRVEMLDYPIAHDHGDPDHHFVNGMNGLIVGITVTGKAASQATWHPVKTLRLFVQSDSAPSDSARRFGYVLQRGAEPRRDSVENPGPVLVLTRGEPTTINVMNRTAEATAVHWHGIEIDSYYDGAVGWSGSAPRTAPAIRPDSSFEVRITPKRAGTFLYHTHFNELRQQFGGLVGALIVLERGAQWDTTRDLLFLLSDEQNGKLLINGSKMPPPKELHVGTTYRLRIADIGADRGALRARLMRDSSVMSWRPVSKDGFTLPALQVTIQPSIARVASGETADFELTPDRPGELLLQFGSPVRVGTFPVDGLVRLRVTQ
jgi:FtsP/CotA-like multicopper oxidase with cupredoxin domain